MWLFRSSDEPLWLTHDARGSFLNRPRYQRFIGVIYRRMTEIPSHYSKCSVAEQYDAVAHIRETRGIQPLEAEDTWKGPKAEVDETFPFGE